MLMITKIIAGHNNCAPKTDPIDSLVFINIGKYSGIDNCKNQYEKEYYIPRHFKAYWHQVKRICESYGLDAVSLETGPESDYLLRLLEPQKHNIPVYIGAITRKPGSKNDWFWINSGNKIDYDLFWCENQPDGMSKPHWGNEQCLSITIDKKVKKLGFNDVFCNRYETAKFVCQKYQVLDTKTKAWIRFHKTFGNTTNPENY